jgi:tetratricopeptide (TPR) repeat protein
VYAAEMANYLLNNEAPGKGLSFIESKRGLLEKTAAGMKTIGSAYLMTGEYQRAVSVLTRAVAAGASDLETDFILGRAYLYTGNYIAAADIFGRLIKFRPEYTRYYTFLGESYRSAGRLMESCEVLERAMARDPDNVPNLINLANTYFTLGWYKKAEQYLLRARDLDPERPEIAINLGVLYWKLKRPDASRAMFDRVSLESPVSQSALNNQANILFLSGAVKPAIKMYKKADKNGKKSEIILYNLGMAYVSAGKIKNAVVCFDEVLMLSPSRMDVINMQASLALQMGNTKSAELYYRKILDLSPGNRDAMARLIILLENESRFEDAMKIVEQYLNDFPQDIEYRLKLPDLYRRMGWYEVAVADYQNLLADKDYRTNAQVFLGLGKCQYEMLRSKKAANYEEIIYTLKKAIELDPDDPEPDLLIGHIYMDYKKYRDLAREHWQNALHKTKQSHDRQAIQDLISGVPK